MDLKSATPLDHPAPAADVPGVPDLQGLPAQSMEDRLQCVLQLVADFYWEQDAACRFTVYRPSDAAHPDRALEQFFGEWTLEAGGRPTSGEADGWRGFQATLAAQMVFKDVACRIADPARGMRRISFSGIPIRDADGRFQGYCGIGRNVGAELIARRLSSLEITSAHALAETDDLHDGLQAVIRCVCESEQWEAGSFRSMDEHGRLHHVLTWPTETARNLARLHNAEVSPAWQTGDPEWLLGIGAVVPVHRGRVLIGVLEFNAARLAGVDPLLNSVLRRVATEVGHFYCRATALARLRESERRFTSTMELAAIGIAHVDESGRLLYVNPQLCKMLQYTEHELTGMTVRQISHPGDVFATDEMRENLRNGAIESFKLEKRYVRKDGSPVWVGLTIAAKRDRDGSQVADISIVEDISARKSAEERVQYLATHDGLTGLPNRAMFGELLKLGIETSRSHDRQLAVLFIDLDRFKIINDSLGHEAGDVLLREIALRLRQCLCVGNVVARLGGDEFVVLTQERHGCSAGGGHRA